MPAKIHDENKKKIHHCFVRLEKHMKELVEKRAKQLGLSRSSYLRYLVYKDIGSQEGIDIERDNTKKWRKKTP